MFVALELNLCYALLGIRSQEQNKKRNKRDFSS